MSDPNRVTSIRTSLLIGPKWLFERKAERDYSHVAFGFGRDFVGGKKVTSLLVFYHPDGRIETYEHHSMKGPDNAIFDAVRAAESVFQTDTFEAYVKEMLIDMEPKKSLERELLEQEADELINSLRDLADASHPTWITCGQESYSVTRLVNDLLELNERGLHHIENIRRGRKTAGRLKK